MIFTLKRSPRIFGSHFCGWNFRKVSFDPYNFQITRSTRSMCQFSRNFTVADSQGPHPSSKRARKILPLVFSSSRRRCIRKFHYVVEQKTSKNCTKNNVLPCYMCRFVVLLRAIFVWPWNENARAKQKQQMNGNRTIWLVYRTDTNARDFWLVKRTLGWFFLLFPPMRSLVPG